MDDQSAMAWNINSDANVQDMTNLSCESRKIQERAMLENRQAFNFLAKLKEFKNEKMLCDVHLHVLEKDFNVHKMVLAAWSSKFSSMILSPTGSVSNLIVGYDNVEAFYDFVEFLYTGFIIPTESNVLSLLDIGKNFLVESLIKYCEDYLIRTITGASFVSRYFTSLKYDLTKLSESVVNFIEANITSVINEISLLNLPAGKFKRLLTCGKMNGMKQEVMFSMIISWVGYVLPERENLLLALFSNISWTHTVNDLLIQISCSENIFTSNEFCLFQLLHSLVSTVGHHLGPFLTTYPRLYSLYSSHLNDLLQPNVLQADEDRDEILIIPVSATYEEKITKPDVKSVEINTDIDSTYFQDCQAVSQADTQDITKEAFTTQLGNAETKDSIEVDKPNDSFQIQSDTNDDIEATEVCETSLDNEHEKEMENNNKFVHRRKSIPRKISVGGEVKIKRSRGRPKKSEKLDKKKDEKRKYNKVSKRGEEKYELENGEELSSMLDIAKEMEDLKNDIEKESNMEILNTQSNSESSSLSTCAIENEHSNESNQEKIPKLKLSLKLTKSKVSKTKPTRTKLQVKQENTTHTLQEKKQTPKPERKPPKPVHRFPCSYNGCSFVAKQKHRLDKHVEHAHLTDVTLTCKYCDFSTSLMRDLCVHMKIHFPKLPYECDVEGCEQKFLRMGLLVRHHMTHMNEKPYKCDMCSKSFGTYNQLTGHKNLHKGRQFECDVCGNRFTTKGVMQQHRAIHFSNKPYLCDTCGFCTKHLSHLISHRKIHTGNVYRCSYQNCSYSSPVRKYFRDHLNAHLNIRNFTCQVCGKSFVVRGKLLRHERIHLKEKLYKCKQCDYQTSRTDRMKLHIESHGIKFKKKKYNLPLVEEEEQEPEIDYHSLYERVQPSSSSSETITVSEAQPSMADITLNQNLTQNLAFPMGTLTDMKGMDAISLAASASMLDGYTTTGRLSQVIDPLTAATITTFDDMSTVSIPGGYEKIHTPLENL